LKKLAKEAKLTEPVTITTYKRNKRIDTVKAKHELISTHIGRKTFITFNVILGVQAEVTMKLTGHKSHKMMEQYYNIQFEQRKEAMNLFSKENLQSKIKLAEINQN
jgi:integrase